jgi:hypothetical protein
LLENEKGIDGTIKQQYPKFIRTTTTINKWVNVCPNTIWTPEPPKEKTAPPTPKQKECCDMGCQKQEPINYRLIQSIMARTLKDMTIKIEVPIISCELIEGRWESKTTYSTLEVFATSLEQAKQIEQLHIANANTAISLCESKNDDVIAAVPDSWLLRPEHHRPQFVFQFGELLKDGKTGSPKYELTVPHPKKDYKPLKSPLPIYTKGNWEVIYVLKDNSKIVIHAINEGEAKKVLNACKAFVEPAYLENSYLSKNSIVESSEPLKEFKAKPRFCKYFPNGRKNMKPEWMLQYD